MPATDRQKAEWTQVTSKCYTWGTWGILEVAPGSWYLYPKPSDAAYGPFPTAEAAMAKAEGVRGD